MNFKWSVKSIDDPDEGRIGKVVTFVGPGFMGQELFTRSAAREFATLLLAEDALSEEGEHAHASSNGN